ncbi:MAG: sensor histidine kinase [Nocardioides sp.]
MVLGAFAVTFVFSYAPGALRMSWSASLAVSTGAAAVVWLSVVRPVAALAVAVFLTCLLPVIGSTFDLMPLLLVMVGFQVAMRSAIRLWLVAVVLLAAFSISDIWLRVAADRTFMEASVLYPLLWCGLAVGLGAQSRQVRVQQEQLIALQESDRRRAVSEERRRIARDVHDIAAHHLSALVVHNKLARRIHTIDALDEAALFTADTASEALDSLKQVVGVLSADAVSPLRPQPSLEDIAEVTSRMESAGLRVHYSAMSTTRLPREAEVAVVRIVQEALANVIRHRGPGRAWVRLTARDEHVRLTIEDDGPFDWRGETGGSMSPQPGRYGLLGMRERAESCGGEFEFGPSSKGGWLVTALLPVTRR